MRRYIDRRPFGRRRDAPKRRAAGAALTLCAAAAVLLFIGAGAESEFVITGGGERRAAVLNMAIDHTLSVTPVFRAHKRSMEDGGAGANKSPLTGVRLSRQIHQPRTEGTGRAARPWSFPRAVRSRPRLP